METRHDDARARGDGAIAAPSDRTTVRRIPHLGVYDRAAIHAIIDEALLCHVGVVVDGAPRVIPTIHARVGDTLYLHGSTASRTMRALAGGGEACVAVTLLDGLVLARSAFEHSMNYRSVIAYGVPREVVDPAERWRAQRALIEHVVPGRAADARMPSDRELRQTMIAALPLTEASAKVRTGPPTDDDSDLGLPVWAGEIPIALVAGVPVPDDRLRSGVPLPDYVAEYTTGRRGTQGHGSSGDDGS